MRELEAAEPSIDRAREGAFFVAEDLALEQRLGNGRAVQRDVRLQGPRAELMDGLRDEFLARAGLAPDEHRGSGRRSLFNGAIHLAHGWALTDEAAEAALLAQLPPQDLDLAQRVRPLDGLVEQDAQPLRIHRLGHVVVSAQLHRLHRRLDRPLGREDDDRDLAEVRAKRPQQPEAVEPRHDKVGHDDRRTEPLEPVECLLPVGSAFGLEAPRTHELGEAGQSGAVVLDHEHPLRESFSHGSLPAGSVPPASGVRPGAPRARREPSDGKVRLCSPRKATPRSTRPRPMLSNPSTRPRKPAEKRAPWRMATRRLHPTSPFRRPPQTPRPGAWHRWSRCSCVPASRPSS